MGETKIQDNGSLPAQLRFGVGTSLGDETKFVGLINGSLNVDLGIKIEGEKTGDAPLPANQTDLQSAHNLLKLVVGGGMIADSDHTFSYGEVGLRFDLAPLTIDVAMDLGSVYNKDDHNPHKAENTTRADTMQKLMPKRVEKTFQGSYDPYFVAAPTIRVGLFDDSVGLQATTVAYCTEGHDYRPGTTFVGLYINPLSLILKPLIDYHSQNKP
ncbi:MAG: hypothetical protein HQM16_08415 [Deltaproteobacteria bacterium]|nr:hypothetical protein [Deltaproteobacteria bacterium]